MAARIYAPQRAKKNRKPGPGNPRKGKNPRNKTYRKGKAFPAVIRAVLWLSFMALFLFICVFFLFKSWTVYDSNGAHIVFPWSEADSEASDGLP